MNDNAKLSDRLGPDAVALLGKIARDRVAAEDHDQFYKHAADVLRPIRQIELTDIRHAAAFALGKLGSR